MKKIITSSFLLLLSLSIFSQTSFEVAGIYYKQLTASTAKVISGSVKYSGNVIIPAQVTFSGQDFSVVEIGDNAFNYCSNMTSVVIPNSVTTIGKGAFILCMQLSSLTIPNSVTFIGQNAFSYCAISSLVIPNSITSIGDRTFQYCNELRSVTIPNSVRTIGKYAFSMCQKLTSIDIPNSVTALGDSSFYESLNLSSISIPNSVASVGYNSFTNTSWFQNQPNGLVYAGKVAYKYKGVMPANTIITLADGTLSIGDYAFANCNGLTNISIPNTVLSIGSHAFYDCRGLTSIVLPNAVSSIKDYTFFNCNDLYSISIPNSINSIGEYALSYCTSLNSITLPSSITSIGSYAFSYCSDLSSISVNASTPIDLMPSYSVFSNVKKSTCKLYVPQGSKLAYQAAIQWKDFVNIIENVTNGSMPTTNLDLHISTNKASGQVLIHGLASVAQVTVYNLSGRQMLRQTVSPNEPVLISALPCGMYLITLKCGEGSFQSCFIK